jgi:integrase
MGSTVGWEKTRYPGVYKRQGSNGPIYRAVKRDRTGRQVTRNFRRIEDAKDWHSDKSTRLQDTAKGKITFEGFARQTLERRADLKRKTLAQYDTLLRVHILPILGDRQLGSIHVDDLEDLYVQLRAKRVGATTIKQAHSLVHSLFQEAVGKRLIPTNPAHGINGFEKPRPKEHRYLTENEVARIAGAINPRYRALVFTLAYAGLRIGEATALRVKHLDLVRGEIHVRVNAPEVNGEKLLDQTPKTESSRRTVLIGPKLVDILTEHIDTYSDATDPEALVFTNTRGVPVKQSEFRKNHFKPAAVRAEIAPPIPTVHDLRHTAASLMAATGFSLLEAGEQLGHTASGMTAAYTHLFKHRLRERVLELDALFQLEPVPPKLVSNELGQGKGRVV